MSDEAEEHKSEVLVCPLCFSTETVQRRETDELVCKSCGSITSLSEALEKAAHE